MEVRYHVLTLPWGSTAGISPQANVSFAWRLGNRIAEPLFFRGFHSVSFGLLDLATARCVSLKTVTLSLKFYRSQFIVVCRTSYIKYVISTLHVTLKYPTLVRNQQLPTPSNLGFCFVGAEVIPLRAHISFSFLSYLRSRAPSYSPDRQIDFVLTSGDFPSVSVP